MPSDIAALFEGLDEFYPGSKTKRRGPETSPAKTSRSGNGPEKWDDRPYVKYINGRERETFTLGALAAALDRPIVTVRLWTKKGYIPQAPYRLPTQTLENGRTQQGRRLYTRAMIEATVKAFHDHGVLNKLRVEWSEHRALSIELFETWTRIYNEESGH